MKTRLLLFIFSVGVLTARGQIGVGTTSPNSTLDVRGSLSIAVTTFTTATTAGASDNMFLFTGTSATTLTLPTAVGITGRVYWIKNSSSNSSTLTIATTSSQTIDGLSSWLLSQTNKAIRLISNGTNWYVAAESLPGSGTAWTLGGNNLASLQNLGTTSNYDLPFITNNTEKMRLTAAGNLGIGITTPPEKFSIYISNGAVASKVYNDSGSLRIGVAVTNVQYGLSVPGDVMIQNQQNKGIALGTNGDNIRMYISNAGNVGIGSSAFNATYPEKLLVDAGSSGNTNYQNVIVGKGNTNSYAQLNIQNSNAGTSASSDVVATADNGNETTNYIDMGINSSVNTNAVFGGANDAYLYNAGQNLLVGTSTAGKSLAFLTGGSTQSTNERMRIDGNGNVGIGTNSPTSLFHVSGTGGSVLGQFVSRAATDRSLFQIYNGASNGASLDLRAYGASYSETLFGNNMTGSTLVTSFNTVSGSSMIVGTYFSNDLILGTSNIERMRLTSGGNVGIGTNSAGYKLTVAGIIAPSADNTYSLGGGTSNRWTAVYAVNGTIQTSDVRLKKNIHDLPYGLNEVMKLNPVAYNWKDNTGGNKIGLIAQEVRKIVPEVVTGDEAKENLGMNYAELVPVLINAIKELKKGLEETKEELKETKNELNKVKKQIPLK